MSSPTYTSIDTTGDLLAIGDPMQGDEHVAHLPRHAIAAIEVDWSTDCGTVIVRTLSGQAYRVTHIGNADGGAACADDLTTALNWLSPLEQTANA